MFYSHSILAKSGPFAHVWLAATWEKKVTRSMIFGTDIATVVESIANPAAPLALRLSANLLVGVVRIYARKARAGVRRGRIRARGARPRPPAGRLPHERLQRGHGKDPHGVPRRRRGPARGERRGVERGHHGACVRVPEIRASDKSPPPRQVANFDELDLDFELDAPLGGGGRPSELTSDPRADEWAAAATTTHRIGHVRDISLADDEEDFAAASLGSRSVAGDDVVGRARRGGPGSDVSSIEIMRGAEDRESNPLSVGGRDSDRFLGRPDDDDAGLVDLEPVGAADLAAVGAANDDEMGFAPPPLDDDDGMDAGLLGPRASGSLGAVDDLAALEAMDEDGAAAAEPDDRSGDPMDVDAAPPAAAPRPKRRRPRRAVDLADAAAALDTDTIKGWMRDRSAIVDVKRPRYDAVAAAPADPLAPRLAPAAAPELAAVVARLHGGDGASARALLPVNRLGAEAAPAPAPARFSARFDDDEDDLDAAPGACAPFVRRGTGYKGYVLCRWHGLGHACADRDACPADLHVLFNGHYALKDCLEVDDEGNYVVENEKFKCECGAPWTTRHPYRGHCTKCGSYEAGLALVEQYASEGKPPPDYMYTWDEAQARLAAEAEAEAKAQADFEATPLGKTLLADMKTGFGKFEMVEDSWNNPRPPLLSFGASATCATTVFGVDARVLAFAAPAEPCPEEATKPSFAARFDGLERASRHRTTTAALVPTRMVLNEAATYHTKHMEPTKTLEELLPNEAKQAAAGVGNRKKQEKKAKKKAREEVRRKRFAATMAGVDWKACAAAVATGAKCVCGTCPKP